MDLREVNTRATGMKRPCGQAARSQFTWFLPYYSPRNTPPIHVLKSIGPTNFPGNYSAQHLGNNFVLVIQVSLFSARHKSGKHDSDKQARDHPAWALGPLVRLSFGANTASSNWLVVAASRCCRSLCMAPGLFHSTPASLLKMT